MAIYLKSIRIGFDLGDTLVHGDSHHNGSTGKKVFYPIAMQIVKDCVQFCDEAFIISKVNEQQRLKALKLLEISGFHAITGMPRKNVFFCARRDQKSAIAQKLRINVFVDDRPEVMAYMDKEIYRILFNPIPDDIKLWKMESLPIARNWAEVGHLIFRRQHD